MLVLTRKETFRVESEEEGQKFIEKEKEKANEEGYSLNKYGMTHKEKKAKGEIIDECWIVELNKTYDSIWGDI